MRGFAAAIGIGIGVRSGETDGGAEGGADGGVTGGIVAREGRGATRPMRVDVIPLAASGSCGS